MVKVPYMSSNKLLGVLMASSKVRLKFRYSFIGLLFVWFCLAITGYPAWLIAEWLSEALAIPEGVPVKDQENGWLWVFLFLLEAISIFVAIYGVLGLICTKVIGWSTMKYINVFWKGEYPKEWHKH